MDFCNQPHIIEASSQRSRYVATLEYKAGKRQINKSALTLLSNQKPQRGVAVIGQNYVWRSCFQSRSTKGSATFNIMLNIEYLVHKILNCIQIIYSPAFMTAAAYMKLREQNNEYVELLPVTPIFAHQMNVENKPGYFSDIIIHSDKK